LALLVPRGHLALKVHQAHLGHQAQLAKREPKEMRDPLAIPEWLVLQGLRDRKALQEIGVALVPVACRV